MSDVIVLSTGFRTPQSALDRHVRSVEAQAGVTVRHLLDDSEEPHFAKLARWLGGLPSDSVCVSVDADDHLLRPDALAIVKREHEAGAWATYGSFRFADGRAGFASQVQEDPRTGPWRMTHLKTYRAGLFRRVRREDLQIDGQWLPLARDLAVMLPVYEMCGPERCRFIETDLYAYNLANAGEWKGGREYRDEERRCVEYVRSRAKYERVAGL